MALIEHESHPLMKHIFECSESYIDRTSFARTNLSAIKPIDEDKEDFDESLNEDRDCGDKGLGMPGEPV